MAGKSNNNSTPEKSRISLPSLNHLLAGGIAGAVSRTAVSPLERIKILFQIQSSQNIQYTSVWSALIKIGKEEGIIGYFKGNGTNVVRMLPYSAVQFAAYEQFKKLLLQPGKNDLTPFLRLTAGAFAGITSVIATYPLDLIRTRLAVQTKTDKMRYTGITNAFITIVKQEGTLALYKGIWPTVMGIAPYVGLNFMCYETLKSFVKTNIRPDPTTMQLLTCGGIAGAVAQTVTYPLDVLRRKMQMQGFNMEQVKYRNTYECMVYTFKVDGWKGFYKGLWPNYLKVVPSISISFVVYEKVKDMLGG